MPFRQGLHSVRRNRIKIKRKRTYVQLGNDSTGAENHGQTRSQGMMKVMGKKGPRISGSIQQVAVVEEVKDAGVLGVDLQCHSKKQMSSSGIKRDRIIPVKKNIRYWRIEVLKDRMRSNKYN
jgi:hypothetical protein